MNLLRQSVGVELENGRVVQMDVKEVSRPKGRKPKG